MTAAICGVFLVGAGLAGCHRDESPASLLADAKQYEQKGDQKAALIQLKNAVEKNPQDGEARLALGMLHLKMGDAVSAEKELSKARSLGIPAARATTPLARALLAQGQFQKVLDIDTPELSKDSSELLALRGHALLGLNKHDEARQAYEQAQALQPNAAEPRLGLARLAAQDKDYEGANRLVEEAAAKDPKNAEAFMFKGGLLRAEGKQQEALAAYEQAIAADPTHRGAHLEKANTEIALGKFDAAKADLDAARKVAPGNLLITYNQALLDFSQGKFPAAQESIQKVLRAAPDYLPGLLLAGAIELNQNALQQADQHLRKYLESDQNNVYARKLLAQVQLKNGQANDAVAILTPALKDSTQDVQLLALAGESYMRANNAAKASEYFEKAVALSPKSASLHASLGMARLGKGDQDKGLSELQLAATLDPKSPQAGLMLVQSELKLRHYDKALAAAQALEKQQPDNAQVQILKGAAYIAKGDNANGRAAFEKAQALQPNSLPAAANLAGLDVQDKKPDAAKQRFQSILEKDKTNVGAMTALAGLAYREGKTDESTAWLEKASAAHPDALAPALRLGAQYLATKQPQKALTLARKFQTTNPTDPGLLDMLGQAQVANKDAQGALETYSKLVNVVPKSAAAQMRLASAHLLLKNDDAAAADLRRAAELQPDFIPARAAQAELAMRRGKPEVALGAAHDLQKLGGDAATNGYLMEGELLMAQNQPAQALAPLQKAYAAAKSPQILVKLAEAMYRAGKAKEAQALAGQWQKDHPEDHVVALYQSERYLVDKQYKPAIAILEGLAKNAPNNPLVLNNLAYAYQQDKDPRALPTAEKALQVAGEKPSVIDTLGWILVEQGNTARALPLLKKAVALAPNSPELRYHLAVGLAKSGDKTGARKELDALLQQKQPFAQLEDARSLLRTL